MQARHYRPEVARFMSRDRYESSALDFGLESDPLTGNLYAFAGGNPVNLVEWDGHFTKYNKQNVCVEAGPTPSPDHCKLGAVRVGPLVINPGKQQAQTQAGPAPPKSEPGIVNLIVRGTARATVDTAKGIHQLVNHSCTPGYLPRTPMRQFKDCKAQISSLLYPRQTASAAYSQIKADVSQGNTAESVSYGATFLALLAVGGKGTSAGAKARGVGRGAARGSAVAGVPPRFVLGAPARGQRVFRVYGGDAGPFGRSWTRVDPRSVNDYRDVAGLPIGNTGRFVMEGTIRDTRNIQVKAADPLHGNLGGLDELLVPNPQLQIQLDRVSGANPKY